MKLRKELDIMEKKVAKHKQHRKKCVYFEDTAHLFPPIVKRSRVLLNERKY